MKNYFLIFFIAFLALGPSTSFAQPDPRIFYPERIVILSDSLSINPNNDALRLERVQLSLSLNHWVVTDIDYLFDRFEKHELQVPMTYAGFYTLYGENYRENNKQLAVSYFRKSADYQKSERVYTELFNLYYSLNNIDSALLYYDTLDAMYLEKNGHSSRREFLYYKKIELLKRKDSFSGELVDFYTTISRNCMRDYKKALAKGWQESEYSINSALEDGFRYQLDLCAYLVEKNHVEEAKKVLEKLESGLWRNKLGSPLNLPTFYRYYYLRGVIYELDGKTDDALEYFLIAVDYSPSVKDTNWSKALLKKYVSDPRAQIIHAQVMYSKLKGSFWYTSDVEKAVLDLFENAEQMGSTDYRIYLVRARHLLFLKEYDAALEQLEKGIKLNPTNPDLYEEKYRLCEEMYWNKHITNEKLEMLLSGVAETIDGLRSNVVRTIPRI